MNMVKHWCGALLVLGCCGARAAGPESLQGGWGHPPTAYNMLPPAQRPDGSRVSPGFAPLAPYHDATVRQVVRLSAAARGIALRLDNAFGTGALHIGAVHVALTGENGGTVPGSDHTVYFSGRGAVDIPPGAPLLSDPIAWSLPAFARLSVSVYYPDETLPPAHTLFALEAWQTSGDHTADTALPAPAPARSGSHLSQIDIVPQKAGATLVTFGDSITEGVASTVGGFRAWPDILAERLQANAATRGWSVVNAGIGSNRLLHDTPSTNALSRFDRDVLAVPGVKAVIVMLGINDIQYSHRNPGEAVTADDQIAALTQLIARAHAAGIRIYGGTITPFADTSDYTPQGEAARQTVNSFIRSGAFDGVADFDQALRDPAAPTRLIAALASRGNLHPNDAGYKAMADSIALALFSGSSHH